MELKEEASDDGSPTTLIRGSLSDQAALHGLLERIRDLNLKLITVERIGTEHINTEHINTKA